jgi:NAD(P)H dehydrogenase (quinone)
MRVLTIYAHPDPASFNHALLQAFTRGLREAGHQSEVVDLYAIGFDPVARLRDMPSWLPDSNAPDMVEKVVRERVRPPGAGPLQRLLAWALFRGMEPLEVVERLRRRVPRDVRLQQEKVSRADALAFIAPVWFVGFPAMLKGWIERVFTLGFAFSLTSAGWRGDLGGRRPLLHHKKALVISTTLFDEAAYRTGLRDAMRLLIDEFALRYPGIQSVEHVFFHGVTMADEETRRGYLARAFQLGRDFETRSEPVAQPPLPPPVQLEGPGVSGARARPG